MAEDRRQPAWVVAGEASGQLEAEILRGMLESLGHHVRLSRESVSAAYSLGVGPLGRVELLVPEGEAQAAQAAIEDYFSAKTAEGEDQETGTTDGEDKASADR